MIHPNCKPFSERRSSHHCCSFFGQPVSSWTCIPGNQENRRGPCSGHVLSCVITETEKPICGIRAAGHWELEESVVLLSPSVLEACCEQNPCAVFFFFLPAKMVHLTALQHTASTSLPKVNGHTSYCNSGFRWHKSRLCNKARASIRPITLNIWLTATWNLLWSAVYQKNCHLVCRNPHIRAAPCSSEKFIPKHINNKGMRKLSKYCSRIAANFAPQKIFLSIHPSPGPVSSVCLSSPLPSLSPLSFSWPNLILSFFSKTSYTFLCVGDGHCMALYSLSQFKT